MALSDRPDLAPLPGSDEAAVAALLSAPAVVTTTTDSARGVKTSEFWVSILALLFSVIDSHFGNSNNPVSTSLSAAIIAGAYTAGRTYLKTPKVIS